MMHITDDYRKTVGACESRERRDMYRYLLLKIAEAILHKALPSKLIIFHQDAQSVTA